MTRFVHLEYPNQHPGVVRVESAIGAARQIKRNFSAPRTLATLLLSAIAAAAMVVAYEIMDSLAEGHLLAMWIALWAAAFATLAAFAGSVSRAVASAQAGLDAWSRNIAVKRADERLWAAAKTDPRVMADLQCAISRNQLDNDPRDEGLSFVAPKPVASDALRVSAKRYGGFVPHV